MEIAEQDKTIQDDMCEEYRRGAPSEEELKHLDVDNTDFDVKAAAENT